MEKLVIVTVFVDVYAIESVETISYDSKESFKRDVLSWQNDDKPNHERFQNTSINHNYKNDLSDVDDGAYEVYTLEEFFQERKVN
jgi:hypothetical protein